MKYRNEFWLAPIPSRNKANRKLVEAKEEDHKGIAAKVSRPEVPTHIEWETNPRRGWAPNSTIITVQESDSMFWDGRSFPVTDWLPRY